jgi:hypothetical protein
VAELSAEFDSLRKDDEVDPAISALVKSTLLNLAQFDAAGVGSAAATPQAAFARGQIRGTLTLAYIRGVGVISRLAITDRGAYDDLLNLITLTSVKASTGEWLLREYAVRELPNVTTDEDRLKAALPTLTAALRTTAAITLSPGFFGSPPAVDVLRACEQLGPKARTPTANNVFPTLCTAR